MCPQAPALGGKCFTFFHPPDCSAKYNSCVRAVGQPVTLRLAFSPSWINMVCIFSSHSYVERPFLFLKGQEVETGPSAAARACTICACTVTLSSSSNIQTSVQFKLAGHGPVTYFPDNMLCNIKGEAVCHQLTNLYRHRVPAKTHETPDGTARREQKGKWAQPRLQRGRNLHRACSWVKGGNRGADVHMKSWGNVKDEGPTGQKLNVKSISTVRPGWLFSPWCGCCAILGDDQCDIDRIWNYLY